MPHGGLSVRLWINFVKILQKAQQSPVFVLFCRHPEPFTAHFLAGSDPDFLVMPQAGELLPEGTVGTHITVGYKPRMYGRKHTATLVIEVSLPQGNHKSSFRSASRRRNPAPRSSTGTHPVHVLGWFCYSSQWTRLKLNFEN